MESLFVYFPLAIRQAILDVIKTLKNDSPFQNQPPILEEIRIRAERPIILQYHMQDILTNYIVSGEEIKTILTNLCQNSIYAYQKEIASGFITVKGGHRVGISGNCVIENDKVVHIGHIYSLNFRIARQIPNCSRPILKYILNLEENTIYNTLIVSPPGYGKTTILRDLARQISTGIKELKFQGINTGIVDERGEIAALYQGIPQTDIGLKTDILSNVDKAEGMKMLIRSMAPKVMIADEIGKKQDIEAIMYAITSGVKGIFTAHGSNITDLISSPILSPFLQTYTLEKIIFLDRQRGMIRNIYQLDKQKVEYILK